MRSVNNPTTNYSLIIFIFALKYLINTEDNILEIPFKIIMDGNSTNDIEVRDS